MKLAANLGAYPAGRPLTADQVTEFHASRILLLIHVSGTKGAIEGLTKLAKLDFFVRYPEFFERTSRHLGSSSVGGPARGVESAMVRHHYGPWDPRYYAVLAYLEAREVITVARDGKTFVFSLTPSGAALARQLSAAAPFQDLVTHMRAVKKLLGGKSGDALKKLVYQLFDDEVAKLQLGEVIRP